MIATKKLVEQIYDKYNKLLFDNRLPKIEISCRKLHKSWGNAKYSYKIRDGRVIDFHATKLTITTSVDFTQRTLDSTVVHEMIHIEDYVFHKEHYVQNDMLVKRYDAHGEWFQRRGQECEMRCPDLIIRKFVTEEESKETTDLLMLQAQQHPSTLIVAKYKSDTRADQYFLFKVKDTNIDTWLSKLKSYTYYDEAYVYETRNIAFVRVRNCQQKLQGWRLSQNDLYTWINKYELNEVYHKKL